MKEPLNSVLKGILILISIVLLLMCLCSCRGAMISDSAIIVDKQVKLTNHPNYKYYYNCTQEGYKVRIYSDKEYKQGQIINIK